MLRRRVYGPGRIVLPSLAAMTVALPRRGQVLPRWFRPNVSWSITWAYLALVLFLPLAGMLLKAAGVGPAAFWRRPPAPWPSALTA